MRTVRETIVTVSARRPILRRGGDAPRPLHAAPLPNTLPDTLFVPGEEVLLLAVDLPLATRAKRLEALPFAIEDRIAEPIDRVHIALGDEISPRRYLVAVVRHERMAAWIALLAAEGRPHAAIVPDMLALPLPAEGAWAVDLRGDRALVRDGAGTGLALPAAALAAAWHAAGRPPCAALGDPLPDAFGGPAATFADRAAPGVDLRQGTYAGAVRRLAGPWRRVAIVLAVALCGHLAILMADTLALRAMAGERADETRALVAKAAPGRWGGDDIMTVAMDLLPASADRAPGSLMPLLGRASNGLAPFAADVTLRSMRFDADGASLSLDIEAADAASLDRAMRALGGAATPAIAEGGRVHAVATLRERASS